MNVFSNQHFPISIRTHAAGAAHVVMHNLPGRAGRPHHDVVGAVMGAAGLAAHDHDGRHFEANTTFNCRKRACGT